MKIKLLFIFLTVVYACGFAQPVNDDPCNAIPLIVGATCTQITGSNYGATASAGVPAPGCGTYTGGDIWFSATCPASGSFTVTTYGSGLNNVAMAMYTGNCASLVLTSCTYIGVGVANMPFINVAGTPGVIYYFRAWNPSNNTVGFFDICATSTSPTPLVPNTQDCLDAIPICQSSFTTTTAYVGTGSVGNEITPGNTCLGSGEKNDVWYQFTVQNAGQLCFAIDPLTNTDDYDWALFNLTSNNCSDIAGSGSALYGACNYSGATTWSGGGSAPTWVLSGSTSGCTGLFPTAPDNTESQCGPCIAVTTGQSFVLNISNFSSTASGFHLFFPPPATPGMAIIYDNIPPVMQSMPVIPDCGSNQAFVKFSENIQCSTIQNGDFSVSGPGGPYTISSVVGSACAGGGSYENQLLLNFTPDLTSNGTYTICLTNASGSVADACNNLAAPACFTFTVVGPNITATPSNPNCSASTGTVVAAGTTTPGPFSYEMDGGAYQASGTFTGLSAGTHTFVTIDNNSGCTATTTALIVIPTAIGVTLTPTNATCANNDGSIASTVSGGTPGYTYAWSPSGAGANPSGLSPAAYTVTVSDTKGCTKTATAAITQTGTVTANFATPAAQCLAGNSFSFTNTGTGGVTYAWNYGDAGTGAGSPVAHSYATSGTFTVTETVTSGVCVATKTVAITVNPTPTVTVGSATICPGASTTLTATGASTYAWSPGTGLSATTGASVTANPTVTTNYTITGTSAAGCTAIATATVTIGGSITPTVNSATICTGNSTTLTAGGATTYTWNTGTGLSATTGASVTANPTVTTTYTITGAIGACTGTVTSLVTVNPLPTVTANTATICIGQQTATLTAGGATTYTWAPAATLSGSTGTSVTANPTVTTNYTITGTNGNGCVNTGVTSVTVNPLPTITIPSATICIGNSTTLTAAGASSYTWSPGTGLSATTGASVTANPTSTTNYTVTATNANGCVNTNTISVTVNPLPTVTVNSATVCPGASATLTAAGASTYTWNTTATGASITDTPVSTTNYTVTGTSAAGCVSTATASIAVLSSVVVGVNSATLCTGNSATLTAGGAATYSWTPAIGLSATSGGSVTANPTTTTIYTVTGSAGTCSATATSTVTVNPLPVITVNSGTICIGQQTAILTAANASTYTWSPATGLSSPNGSPVTATPTTTTSYTVTGTDANGCVNTKTTSVTVNPLPTLNVNSGFICNGSTATLNVSGASTYTWSPATGLSATNGASVNGNPVSTTQYTVTGTDANGCVSSDTTRITVVNNPTVTVGTATICIGQQTATLTAAGASTYVWAPATGLSSTSGTSVTATPTVTTIYTITGTAGTCTAVATTTVTVNPLPVVTVNSGTICIGQQTATLTAGAASTYTWSPATGLSSANGSPVTATPTITTSYTVTGTDANGCVNTNTTSVTVNTLPIIILNNALICTGASTTLNAGGASTYAWAPGTGLSGTTGASVTANPTSTTNYTITGTDINGCFNSDTTSVTVVSNPTVSVASATICVGQQTATLTANGASTYVWSPATGLSSTTGTSVTANPTVTTNYIITGTSGTAGTCTAVTTTTVTVNPLPLITVNSGTICIGQQTATLTAANASTYTWSPATGLSSANGSPVTATPTTTTSYTVTGTDANGCVNTNTTSVTVNTLPIIILNNALICTGASTTLNAGGASTYAWAPGTGLSGTTGASVTANPTSTTNYTITGTDINGCTNHDTTSVTVVPNPTVSVASATICVGQQTATLTANGASTYVWSPATGLSSTTGTSVTANPTVTTNYIITGTSGTAGTCTAVTTTTVTVNPLPVITAISNSPVCVNQTLTLTATGGSGYTWIGPNSFSSAIQNPTVTGVTIAANGTYSLIVSDANACINTATVSVVINPLPIVTATGATVCIGSTFTLSATGGVNYSWGGPNAYTSNQHNPIVTNSTLNMTGSYIVTATDANGCINANVAQVLVNPLPVVTVNTGTICIGKSTTLTAAGANSYNWTPTTGLSSATGASVTANPITTTSYSVIGTDLNGCANTATTSVTVNPLPALSITPPTSTGCAPVCISFSNTTTATGTCNWIFGDGTTSTNCAANHCYTRPGTSFSILTLTDLNGCKNSDTASITVYPMPTANFNFDPQPTTILDPVIYFHNQTVGAFITTNSWTFGDPLHGTSAVVNPSHTYLDPGSYPVQLVATSNYGCKDSITKIVVIGEDYFIYVPNAFSPNFDGINDLFFAKGEGIKDFKLYIFDRWGNQLFYSEDIYKGWDGRYQAKGNDIVLEDVYVWKIELKNYKGEPKMLKGIVSLIK